MGGAPSLGGSRSPPGLAICKPRRRSRVFCAAWKNVAGHVDSAGHPRIIDCTSGSARRFLSASLLGRSRREGPIKIVASKASRRVIGWLSLGPPSSHGFRSAESGALHGHGAVVVASRGAVVVVPRSSVIIVSPVPPHGHRGATACRGRSSPGTLRCRAARCPLWTLVVGWLAVGLGPRVVLTREDLPRIGLQGCRASSLSAWRKLKADQSK
jgi:hypothetical protein